MKAPGECRLVPGSPGSALEEAEQQSLLPSPLASARRVEEEGCISLKGVSVWGSGIPGVGLEYVVTTQPAN